MITHLHRSFGEPLSEEMLFSWHGKMLKGRRDLKDVGRYRRSAPIEQEIAGFGRRRNLSIAHSMAGYT